MKYEIKMANNLEYCTSRQQAKASVIINCLNGEKYLRDAIDSVYAQTFNDWEIIFWDNASTDNSGKIAKSYDRRVKYFRSERTYPLGTVRNLAFEKATGEYVAILDCDDMWLPKKLEKQVGLFNKNPQLGMTYSNSIFFDAEGEKFLMFHAVTPSRGRVFGELLRNNFISSETIVFRKSALDSLDYLFNEEFTMVMDYDLTLRIAYLYEMDFIEEPLSKWRMHPKSGSNVQRFQIPYENIRMLEILLRWKPDIAKTYAREIALFRKAVQYDLALEAWSKGNTREVWNFLVPYISDAKCFATCLVSSVVPFRWYEKIKPKIQQALLWLKGVRS